MKRTPRLDTESSITPATNIQSVAVYNVVQPADCCSPLVVCRIERGLVKAVVNADDDVQNPLANPTPAHPINDTLEAMQAFGGAQ